ncbi:uncharacterized protein LOC113396861 [Vanessa tameamea]|uniref:Uncharacterized protein LOC113396861 n=1 Tax=Vanessa tameamea TaxID=334116 RepID=A0A8B8I3M3_VANTA|nr:uncharacterized protein LOC113396861 [Vanessa tameamea]
MATLIDCIVEFLRVRQLNIALAALLTLAYFVYQYRKTIFKLEEDDGLQRRCSSRMSRSRSKSRSRSRTRADYKLSDMKRRGRKPTRRCPDCSLCNFDE